MRSGSGQWLSWTEVNAKHAPRGVDHVLEVVTPICFVWPGRRFTREREHSEKQDGNANDKLECSDCRTEEPDLLFVLAIRACRGAFSFAPLLQKYSTETHIHLFHLFAEHLFLQNIAASQRSERQDVEQNEQGCDERVVVNAVDSAKSTRIGCTV